MMDLVLKRREHLRGLPVRELQGMLSELTGKPCGDNIVRRVALRVANEEMKAGVLMERMGVSNKDGAPPRGIARVCKVCGRVPSGNEDSGDHWHKCCPVKGCTVSADNFEDLDRLFGFRVVKRKIDGLIKVPQSRCKKHRAPKPRPKRPRKPKKPIVKEQTDDRGEAGQADQTI